MPLHPFDWGRTPTGKYDCLREQIALMACLYRNQRAFYQLALDVMEGNAQVVTWTFQENTLPPSWATWATADTVGVTINGTRNERAMWLSHFSGLPGKVANFRSAIPGRERTLVHKYHYDQAQLLYPQLLASWGDISGKRILVCGHSFGASVANFIGLALVQDGHGPRTAVVTFGEPRGMGVNFADLPALKYRSVNTGDLVTAVPMGWTLGLLTAGEDRNKWRGGWYWRGKAPGIMPMAERGGGAPEPVWIHVGGGDLLFFNGNHRPLRVDESGWPSLDFALNNLNVYRNHVVEGSLERLRANAETFGASTASTDALAIGEIAAALPVAQGDGPPWGPGDYYSPEEVARDAFLLGAPPVTSQDVKTAEGVALTVRGYRIEPAPNKGETGGAMPSGIWDVTFCINNDLYGKTQTFGLNLPGSIEGAREAAFALAAKRASLLGRNVGVLLPTFPVEPVGKGTPVIELIRIRDAKDPRYGQVFDVPLSIGGPSVALAGAEDGGPTDNAADPLWVALTTSLYAVSSTVPNTRARYTLSIVGQPDRCVRSGGIDWNINFGGAAPNGFQQRMIAFLDTLVPPAGGQWGLTGQDTSVPFVVITSWGLDADGQWYANTATPHGFATEDRVTITRTKKPYLNRVWQIIADTTTRFTLRGSQGTPLQQPTTGGKARLWQTAAGIRQVAFYSFQRPPAGFLAPLPFWVVKRNPGRRVTRVSFRRRQRSTK